MNALAWGGGKETYEVLAHNRSTAQMSAHTMYRAIYPFAMLIHTVSITGGGERAVPSEWTEK